MLNKYVQFNELEQGLTILERDDYNDICCMDVMIVLLLRSGIAINDIVKLKNSDFDFNKQLVTIRNNNTIHKLKLDEKVLNWVIKSRDWDGKVPRTRFVMNTLEDHVIRLNGDVYDEEQARRSIKRRLAKFRENGFTPMNENVLINSKKIDVLDGLVERQGSLGTEDFKKVQVQFGNSEGSYFKLKADYQAVRGSEHIRLKQRGRKQKQAN